MNAIASTRLVIADDHPMFRDALRQAVASVVASVQIEEAGSFECELAATDNAEIAKTKDAAKQNKLKFGEIWFKRVNDTPQFKAALVQAATAKWGASSSKPGEEMQMWIAPDFHSATVSKIIDLEEEGWQIQIALK